MELDVLIFGGGATGLWLLDQLARRGDRVLLMETRPLSATKRWRVVEILEKAK